MSVSCINTLIILYRKTVINMVLKWSSSTRLMWNSTCCPPNPIMIIAFPLYGNNQSMKNDCIVKINET